MSISFLQEFLDLCHSSEAPSGVMPTQSESQLESTGVFSSQVERHPRLIVDLSTIDNRPVESSAQEDVEVFSGDDESQKAKLVL